MSREIIEGQGEGNSLKADLQVFEMVGKESDTNNPGCSTKGEEANIKTIDDVLGFMIENFNQIDQNRNGHITESELRDIRKNRRIPIEDQRLVQSMFGKVELVEEVNDDEWFDENDGITKNDLKSLKYQAKTGKYRSKEVPYIVDSINARLPIRDLKDQQTYGQALLDWFPKIDADRSQSLSRTEIDRFEHDPRNAREGREVSQVLSRHFNDFKNMASQEPSEKFRLNYRTSEHFYNDKDNTEISKRDVYTFSNLLSNPDAFDMELKAVRREELVKSSISASNLGASVLTNGLVSMLDPRPTSKLNFGTSSLAHAAVRMTSISLAVRGNETNFENLYNQRQKMIDSWKYFK